MRKINEIMLDPEDDRKELKLARRKPEFKSGTIDILCRNAYKNSFANLEYISLYGNELRTVSGIEVFKDSPINCLNLGKNKLSDVPMSLNQLSSLKYLSIEDNSLESFPVEEIKSLEHLTTIRLSNNPIDEIPESIEGLSCISTLKELIIDVCQLSSLPLSLGAAVNLERLNISGNQISELPSSISGLKKLKYLYMSSNNLLSLPSYLGNCVGLEILLANGNDISEIHDCLSQLSNLKRVNLCNNNIATLSENIRELWKDNKRPELDVTFEGNPFCVSPFAISATLLSQCRPLTSTWKMKGSDASKGGGVITDDVDTSPQHRRARKKQKLMHQ